MALKCCLPKFDKNALTIENNQASGFGAGPINAILDIFSYVSSNISLIPLEKFGDIIDRKKQRYDGCIGELQQGRLDFALMPADFPLMAPNITNGAVYMSSTTTIISSYNNTFDNAETDVMECFKAFNSTLWLMVVFAFVILAIIQLWSVKWRMKKKVRKKFPSTSFLQTLLTAVLMKQFTGFNITSEQFTVRLVFILMALFFFLVHFYFTSMIKTDMVVMKRPDTISTYEEILSRPDCRPQWSKAMSSHYEFSNADPGSPASEIWERANKIGTDKCFFDPDVIMKNPAVMEEIRTRKAVVFLPSVNVYPVVKTLCAFSRANKMFTDMNVWSRTDPVAKEHLVMTVRSSFVPREIAIRMDDLATIALEFGLRQLIIRPMSFDFGNGAGQLEAEDCVANVILYPEHELASVKVRHYTGVAVSLFIGFLLAAFVQMFEFSLHYARSVRSIQPMKHAD